MRPCLIRLAVVAIVAFSASANAEVIRYDFTGILTEYTFNDGNLGWVGTPPDIAVGDHFTGHFLVNTDATLDYSFQYPSDEAFGGPLNGFRWGYYNASLDVSLVVNGVDIFAPHAGVQNYRHGYYHVSFKPDTRSSFSYNLEAGDQSLAYHVHISLGSSSSDLLNSRQIPTNLDQLFSQCDIRKVQFVMDGQTFPYQNFTGQIQTFVPEPATGALMLAMAAIGLTRRPRR
ncbi:MAG: PEP-CTERM sorting domain-containing protein [Phycisphaeraceae bacterium]|nr:PEP-CTERM sorting domain-containing protein [Phycisphaeraceae bacterium]